DHLRLPFGDGGQTHKERPDDGDGASALVSRTFRSLRWCRDAKFELCARVVGAVFRAYASDPGLCWSNHSKRRRDNDTPVPRLPAPPDDDALPQHLLIVRASALGDLLVRLTP